MIRQGRLLVKANATNVLVRSALTAPEVSDRILNLLPLAEAPSHDRGKAMLSINHQSQSPQPACRHPGEFNLEGGSIALPGIVPIVELAAALPEEGTPTEDGDFHFLLFHGLPLTRVRSNNLGYIQE